MFFVIPALIPFFAVVIVPFIYGIYLTFTDWDGISATHKFIGIRNYVSIFKDPDFISKVYITIKYVVFTVLLSNIMGFFLAYILTSGIKYQNILRAGFFTPNLIGGIILGYIWKFIFADVLTKVGQALNIDWLSTSILTDENRAIWGLIVVSVWQYSGYLMLIYIAGFMSVPSDLLEASEIDGATGFKKVWYVTIPLMIPAFVICLFISISRSFMTYDLNLSLTKGEPYGATQLIAMHIYQKAFSSQEYGTGQAEAIVLFFIVAIATGIQVYFTKKMEVEA